MPDREKSFEKIVEKQQQGYKVELIISPNVQTTRGVRGSRIRYVRITSRPSQDGDAK